MLKWSFCEWSSQLSFTLCPPAERLVVLDFSTADVLSSDGMVTEQMTDEWRTLIAVHHRREHLSFFPWFTTDLNLCHAVRPSVRPCVRPSVRPSSGWSFMFSLWCQSLWGGCWLHHTRHQTSEWNQLGTLPGGYPEAPAAAAGRVEKMLPADWPSW